ncbi:uncharacterized protein LOC110101732 [Dendrobium catenatum]|uniref:uncharacterized protein LOC110101732 n=1 Tax=Dendrobium catenatum TaxID=906689 RepID=UPI0009F47E59|nr:uncharacterized protein LOC110101732 [Dendrobium catenatum]
MAAENIIVLSSPIICSRMSLIQKLKTDFSLKELVSIFTFLGVQVQKMNSGLFLHQSRYAENLLDQFDFSNCRPVSTPLALKPPACSDAHQPFSDPTLYRRLAGSLMYLTITRPDLAYATNHIYQSMHHPTNQHFQSLKCLLRYIKGTINFGIPFCSGDLQLHTFVDSDWAADKADHKSVISFFSYLGPNLVSWHVKKQATVAKSSTEAEYRALSAATSDVLWLRHLLHEFHATQSEPTPIYCDNTSTIALAHNPVFHARTKHIELDYHFISEHIRAAAILFCTSVHLINRLTF